MSEKIKKIDLEYYSPKLENIILFIDRSYKKYPKSIWAYYIKDGKKYERLFRNKMKGICADKYDEYILVRALESVEKLPCIPEEWITFKVKTKNKKLK